MCYNFHAFPDFLPNEKFNIQKFDNSAVDSSEWKRDEKGMDSVSVSHSSKGNMLMISMIHNNMKCGNLAT